MPPAASAAAEAPARDAGAAEYLTLALLSLIWGTTWAVIRIGLGGIPPFAGVALRFAVAAAVLAAVARLRGVPVLHAGRAAGGAGSSGRRPWRMWLANAALTFFVAYGVLYWAEQWVPSGLAAVLFATLPLWVAVAAHLALPAERLNRGTAMGILVGFAGVALIFSQDLAALGGPRVAGAAALLLLSPLASALGVVAVKRWGGGLHPLTITTVPMALAALAMGCVAAACEGGRPARWDAVSVSALLYLALVGSALPFALYFWLLGRLPVTMTSLINYVTPLVALLLGSAALGERVTASTVGGALLVVGGVAAALRARAIPR